MPVSDQGNLSGRYVLVPRTLVFLTCGERILLLKGAPEKRLWANLYNGIGGHIEPGEDILHAALRELQEETGLALSKIFLRGVIVIDTEQETGIVLFVFHDNVNEENVKNTEEFGTTREGKLEWVKRGDLEKLPLVEDLPILLRHLFTMQSGDPPFIARSWYNERGELQIDFSE